MFKRIECYLKIVIISFLFLIITACQVIPNDSISDSMSVKSDDNIVASIEDDLLSYEIVNGISEKYAVVRKGKKIDKISELIIPNEINGFLVKGIAINGFKNCDKLVKISIPDSISIVGTDAFFGCESLKLNIYENCNYLGNEHNPYLILMNAIDSSITDVEIHYGTKIIYDHAFKGMINLKSILLTNNIVNVGSHAFENCRSLRISCENVNDNWAKDWNIDKCEVINNLVTYHDIQYGIINNDVYVVYISIDLCEIQILDEVIIQNSKYKVQGVYKNLLKNRNWITSISFPKNIKSLEKGALSGCSELKHITTPFIGASKDAIGKESMFGYIFGTDDYYGGTDTKQYYNGTSYEIYYIPNSLKEVIITDNTNINYGAFYNCSSITLISIPNNVKSIGDYVFTGCNNLQYNEYDNGYYLGNDENPYLILVKAKNTSIVSCVVNRNAKFVSSNAFFECYDLQKVTFEEDSRLEVIGYRTFYNCSSLDSIIIPNSVISIGSNAFQYCISLATIVIPNSVTSIGSYAFYGCSSLTIYCEASGKPSGWNSTWNSYRPVYWGVTNEDIIYKDGLQYLIINGEAVVTRCDTNITNIVLPETIEVNGVTYDVTSIGDYAFSECSSLTTIVIPNSVTSIGERAFSFCRSLSSIVISNSVTSIGGWAFSFCSSLTSIEIPNSVTSIGSYAFYGCSSLTSIVIPNSVTSIGEDAFSGCSSLTSIVIPNSVTSIGRYAFFDCSSLTIYCEASSKPSGWDSDWNYWNRPVVWNYKSHN